MGQSLLPLFIKIAFEKLKNLKKNIALHGQFCGLTLPCKVRPACGCVPILVRAQAGKDSPQKEDVSSLSWASLCSTL